MKGDEVVDVAETFANLTLFIHSAWQRDGNALYVG